jgi:hypothetical protein
VSLQCSRNQRRSRDTRLCRGFRRSRSRWRGGSRSRGWSRRRHWNRRNGCRSRSLHRLKENFHFGSPGVQTKLTRANDKGLSCKIIQHCLRDGMRETRLEHRPIPRLGVMDEAAEETICGLFIVVVLFLIHHKGIGFKPILCAPRARQKIIDAFPDGGTFRLCHMRQREVTAIFTNEEFESSGHFER